MTARMRARLCRRASTVARRHDFARAPPPQTDRARLMRYETEYALYAFIQFAGIYMLVSAEYFCRVYLIVRRVVMTNITRHGQIRMSHRGFPGPLIETIRTFGRWQGDHLILDR